MSQSYRNRKTMGILMDNDRDNLFGEPRASFNPNLENPSNMMNDMSNLSSRNRP